MKKILAFGAHPDDVEFGAGALLIKEIEKGNKVIVVVGSLGESGTNGTPEGRKKEATAAARFIGAGIEFLDLGGDSHITVSPKNSIKVAEVIRKYKPDIVLAPSITPDQHPDHLAVAEMARNAARLARYGGLKELKKHPTHSIGALYFYPSNAKLEGSYDIVIDVSQEYEKWVQAMSHHKSQMKTKNYLEMVLSRARALGASVGVEYAIGIWANEPVRLNALSDLNLSSRNY